MPNRRQRRAKSKQLNTGKQNSLWDEYAWILIVGGFVLFFIGFIVWQKQKAPLPSGSHIVSTQLLEESRPFEIVYGRNDAPVTIIEYASMSCGSCKAFHDSVVVPLKQSGFYNGSARLLFRHYPLNKPALDAALLLSCAPQKQAIGILDTLFLQQEKWALAEDPLVYLNQYFTRAGMNQTAIERCLADKEQKEALAFEQSRAHEELDIRSTPTVFINGTLYTGPYHIKALEKEIASALKKTGEEFSHE